MKKYTISFMVEGGELFKTKPLNFIGVMWELVKLGFALRKGHRAKEFSLKFVEITH